MSKSTTLVMGTCISLALGSAGLLGQTRGRAAAPQAPVNRDAREDVRDRREDVRDRREDVRDVREDVRDAQRDGGIRDQREDVRDAREDVRDRREDVRDRLEDRIDRNPRLAGRVRALLPPNRSLGEALLGFSNQGQFIAALHVSRNLNIPFDELKTKMTGDSNMTLAQAIRDSRPNLNERSATNEARKAEQQARQTEE